MATTPVLVDVLFPLPITTEFAPEAVVLFPITTLVAALDVTVLPMATVSLIFVRVDPIPIAMLPPLFRVIFLPIKILSLPLAVNV